MEGTGNGDGNGSPSRNKVVGLEDEIPDISQWAPKFGNLNFLGVARTNQTNHC